MKKQFYLVISSILLAAFIAVPVTLLADVIAPPPSDSQKIMDCIKMIDRHWDYESRSCVKN